MRPAALDVQGIKRLAIFDFRGPGNSGEIAASYFVSKLWETNFYTLIERSEIEKILQEIALGQSGVMDTETAIKAGNLLGVDAVILGDVVSYKTEDSRRYQKVKKRVWTGEYEKDDKGNIVYEKTLFGKVKKKKYREVFVTQEIIEREATVSLAFRLVDVNTGQIRASRHVSKSFKKSAVSGEGELPPKEEVLNNLLQQCVDDFVKMLSPHYVEVKTQFASGDAEVKEGIRFAKNGLWEDAQRIWEEAVRKNPENHAAWYNLGLAYEAQGNYLEAEKMYQKAVRIKSEKLYLKALKRIKQEIRDYRKLQEQLKQLEEKE